MSRRTTFLISVFGGCGLVAVSTVSAADLERDPNRFSLNGRFTFGVDAKFTSVTPAPDLGVFGAIATTPAQAGNVVRTYDDGFIGVDISGNAGDATTFWSYADLSQIAGLGTPGGTLSFHSASSPADQFSLGSRDKVLPGFDFQFSRDLGSFDMEVNGRPARAWYGFALAFGYTDLNLSQGGSVTAPVALTTDTYAIGAVIPPAPPFQGTVPGPGTVIPDSPTTRVTAATPATATVGNEVDGSLYGFTAGPFLEIPFSERLIAEVGVGMAAALVDRSYTFSESVAIAGVPTTIRSGAGSDLDWIFGGVANVGLSYRISRRARIRIGLQYQKLGTTGQSVGGKTARIGFNDSISVSAGANWSF